MEEFFGEIIEHGIINAPILRFKAMDEELYNSFRAEEFSLYQKFYSLLALKRESETKKVEE